MLASITIWNSGSINREFNPEFSSGKRPFSDLYDFENSKCCALCPMTGNSFSRHKLWHSRDKLWIILTIPPVIKIRYIGQCVKNKIHEYRYICAIHLFLCLFCFCNVYICIFHVVCACQFIWYVSLPAVCKVRVTLAWKRSGSIFELILISVLNFRKCRKSIFLRCQTYALTLL